MNDNFFDSSDGILAASIAAMRDRPIPDGPSEALVTQTVSALNAAAARKPSIFSRLTERATLARIAAGLLIVVGVGILAAVMLRSTAITIGEVLQTVRGAHAMSLVMTAMVPPAGQMRMTMMMNDEGEASVHGPDGSRTITDVNTGKIVVIQPAMKSVIVMDMKNLPPDQQRPDGMIEGFKNLSEKNAQDLGPTEIDGRRAEKFIATQDRQEFTVWADPQTREPIRIDITVSTIGKKVTVSFTDFVMNPPIPEGEFSQAIPPGYAVQEFTLNVPNLDDGQKNLVEMFRGYAARAGGKYPPNLDNMDEYMKMMVARGTTRPTSQDMNWVVRFQMVQHFLSTLPKDGWKYLGNGKTTADKNALIFWYKTDSGYRGIYGDLTAKDFSSVPR